MVSSDGSRGLADGALIRGAASDIVAADHAAVGVATVGIAIGVTLLVAGVCGLSSALLSSWFGGGSKYAACMAGFKTFGWVALAGAVFLTLWFTFAAQTRDSSPGAPTSSVATATRPT